MGRKQFERIEPYYKQKQERKNVQENKRTKIEKQSNKRNKQKKTYREIAMEKQANTSKIRRKKKRKKQGKQTMRMTTAGRKPIACWPETDAEGGVESTSRGDARKDRQRTAKWVRRRSAVY
jgi:hypothetical protein